MSRTVLPLAAYVAALAGCGSETYSHCLIAHRSTVGLFRQAMLGDVDSLIARGRVDAHLRVEREDGAVIDTWVLRGRGVEASRGTVVLLHGLWDSKARFFDLGEELARRGYDVVLPDNRCHGRSSGQYITWGAKEKHDVRAAVDAAIAGCGVSDRVYVLGLSMGGCIAVQYAACDPRVQGCVAVAPAAGAREVLRRMFPLAGDEALEESLAVAGRKAGFDPADASAVAAAARLTCGLVVVHGKADVTVPFAHGQAIYDAAAGPRELHAIPLAGHYTVLLGRRNWFADQVERLVRGEVTGRG